jgi:hypothetical protein
MNARHIGMVFTAWLLLLPAYADGPPRLLFEGIRPTYHSNLSVKFAVRSAEDRDLRFGCAVEWLDQNEWREIVTSIHEWRSKAAVLYPLPRRGSATLRFDMGRMTVDGKSVLPSGSYRFRLDVFGPKHLQKLQSVFSARFAVVSNR